MKTACPALLIGAVMIALASAGTAWAEPAGSDASSAGTEQQAQDPSRVPAVAAPPLAAFSYQFNWGFYYVVLGLTLAVGVAFFVALARSNRD